MATRYTKKDYIAVARILAESYGDSHSGEDGKEDFLKSLIEKFSILFQNDNAAFDESRFNEFLVKLFN